MPETDLESLIARAENGDWEAVGELFGELRARHLEGEVRYRPYADDYQGAVTDKYEKPPMEWETWYGYGDSGPAAIARAARAALEGVENL